MINFDFMDGSGVAQDGGNNWQESIKKELAGLSSLSSTWSICNVPSKLRNVNQPAYSPQIVSIGPIHHEKVHLQAMENHKLHYMLSLVERTQNPQKTLETCGEAILLIGKEVRVCYAEPIKYSEDELVKMLLLDGCFIIELVLRYTLPCLRGNNDPIFTTSWMCLTLRHDLALLENQVPFIVLDTLFNRTVKQSPVNLALGSLPVLALCFFMPCLDINKLHEATLGNICSRKTHHLLDLIHCCFLLTCPTIVPSRKETLRFIHCATALSEAGIEFRNQ